MAFQQYLAEEVAIDHADGLILAAGGAAAPRPARRRRAAAASPLLAACGGDGEPAGGRHHRRGRAATPTAPRSHRGDHLRRPARADRPGRLGGCRRSRAAAVLVIHENRGPHRPHPLGRRPARRQRLLGAGHRPALGRGRDGRVRRPGRGDGRARAAPRRSGSSPTCGPAWTSWSGGRPARSSARSGSASAAAWCGGCSASGEPRLAAAAPFYGPLPDDADFSGSPNAAVLGIYAELDDRVNATRRRGHGGAGTGRADPRDRHLPGRQPRLLQRHRPALRPGRGRQAYSKVLDWFGQHLS